MKISAGRILVIFGVIHTIFASIVFSDFLAVMIENGLVNAIKDEPSSNFAVHWFMLSGYFWMITGYLMHYITDTLRSPLPRFLGFFILLFGAVAVVLQPISGAWVFVPFGLSLVYKHKSSGG